MANSGDITVTDYRLRKAMTTLNDDDFTRQSKKLGEQLKSELTVKIGRVLEICADTDTATVQINGSSKKTTCLIAHDIFSEGMNVNGYPKGSVKIKHKKTFITPSDELYGVIVTAKDKSKDKHILLSFINYDSWNRSDNVKQGEYRIQVGDNVISMTDQYMNIKSDNLVLNGLPYTEAYTPLENYYTKEEIDETINKKISQGTSSSQDISGKLDKSHPTHKGQNVVVDSTSGEISFEAKNNHTHNQYLTSHQTLKTINNQSILGSGNINISSQGSIDVDSSLSSTSTNPVQNKAIYSALQNKANSTDIPSLTNYVQKSNVNGLIRNNGSIDTNTYLTTHQSLENYIQKSDVKDNLTSSDADKPLSANQGKELKTLVDTKQTALVSGTSIKTINGESILGSGNITIAGSPLINIYEDDGITDNTADYGSSIPLRNNGTSTITHNQNGYYTITNTTTQAESFIPLNELTGVTDDFILEFDSYIEGSNGSSGLVIYNSATSWEKLTDDGDSTKRTWYGYNDGSFHETGYNASIVTNQKWIHHKYTIQNNIFSVELTYDGTVVWTHTITMHLTRDNNTKYGFDSEWQSNTVTRYKNITVSTLGNSTGSINIVDMIYPIGSIYMSVNNMNPENLFGGLWERIGQGRTIVGEGTWTDSNNETKTFSNGATGGEYSHTLTRNEIPKHYHPYTTAPHGWAERDTSASQIISPSSGSSKSVKKNTDYQYTDGDTDKPHNNIQPYLVVYMWKRVS